MQKYCVQALACNEIAVVNQIVGLQDSSTFNESRHKMVGLYLWNSGSETWMLQAVLQLELPLDPSAKATVQSFQKMGKNVYLVSGDENRLVRSLGDELGLDASHVFGEMNVEQKSLMVQSKAPAMMVGDGVNDALALRQAHVGVAVVGGVELALENASVFMTQSGVGALIQLYQISQQAHRLIRRNLTISLIYNLIGGTLALMGYVNPFVAAVLMPISSGFILLSSWLGGRD
jgi:Cu2+-exporting ATPase/Cu+-exporting ATPase